jgi:hypothetical protein
MSEDVNDEGPSEFDLGYLAATEERTDKVGSELAMALVKAQETMPSVHKDAANPYFKSKYATLAACVEAARTVLAECRLAVVQFPISEGDQIGLRTLVVHESGEYLEDRMLMKNQKPGDAQYFGSAITYFRRYAFCSALGIVADDDDDGNKAITTYTATDEQKKVLASYCEKLGMKLTKEKLREVSDWVIEHDVKMVKLFDFLKLYSKGNN